MTKLLVLVNGNSVGYLMTDEAYGKFLVVQLESGREIVLPLGWNAKTKTKYLDITNLESDDQREFIGRLRA